MINLKDYTIIPLGNDCAISYYLRNNGLRKIALPFDWNVTPVSSALSLIENNFVDFLLPGNVISNTPTGRLLFDEESGGLKISNEIITPVMCKKHKMLLPHDFSEKGLNELEYIKGKYKKRIKRLYDILEGAKTPVVFIAANNKLNNWQIEQYQQLGVTFDNSDFAGWKKRLQQIIESRFKGLEYKMVDFDEIRPGKNSIAEKLKKIKRFLLSK